MLMNIVVGNQNIMNILNKVTASVILLITLVSCISIAPQSSGAAIPKLTDLPILTPTPKPHNTPTAKPAETSTSSVFLKRRGQQIAFTSNRDGNQEIYIMNADGTDQTNLTRNPADDGLPTWSPDGSRISFISDRTGELDIYLMNPDGSELLNLTNHSGNNTSPIWSPDGKQIAFISDRDGHEEVYVMNIDGSKQTRLTNDPNTKSEPSWSPDGKHISFTYNDFGNYNWDVYSVEIENHKLTRLTNDPGDDTTSFWSPDGAYICFISTRDRGRSLYRMYPDGSHETRVIWPWVESMVIATWSPIGSSFAEAWAPPDQSQKIYIFSPDGSKYHQLSKNTTLGDDSSPNWSPDGKWITFTSSSSSNSEIYVVKIDGTELVQLTHDNVMDQSPIWQPLPILQH